VKSCGESSFRIVCARRASAKGGFVNAALKIGAIAFRHYFNA
jgi:hypothetical protein